MPLSIEAEARIHGLLDRALSGLDEQVLVANGACVNALLDLFGSTEDPTVRRACTDVLQRIGRVNLVRADEFRADLQTVAAAAASAAIEVDDEEQRALVEPAV